MEAHFEYSEDTVRRFFDKNYIPNLKDSEFLTSITTSSLLVKQNSFFVPLIGPKFDGHDFIIDALEQGCVLFLCQENHAIIKKLSSQQLKKAIFVEDTLKSLGDLAKFHRDRFDPFVIAITGSNGKTTTKEILKNCLMVISNHKKSSVVYTEKNYNNQIGLPFTIFKINAKTRFLICELGMNQKGEISLLSQILKADISLLTNIGTSHIGNFNNQREIAKEKISIIEGMKKKSTLIVDDNILYLSFIQEQCEIFDVSLKKSSLKTKIKILKKLNYGYILEYRNQKFEWKIPGEKILENLNICICALEEIHSNVQDIIIGLNKFKPIENRLSFQTKIFEIVNDCYNANFESMCFSIQTISELNNKDLYLILGEMLELGDFSEGLHEKLGVFIHKFENIKGILLFGEEARYILKGIPNKNKYEFVEFFNTNDNEISRAIRFIHFHIQPKSRILIKGSRSVRLERIIEKL